MRWRDTRGKREQLLSSTEITPAEERALARIAEQLKANDERHDHLIERRLKLWRKLIDRGVQKKKVAKASGITHGAMNYNLGVREK